MKNEKGKIRVVDWSPLNWLYVLFNTMEEFVRVVPAGRIVPSLAKAFNWIDSKTLSVSLREPVSFHNGQPYNAKVVQRNFEEVKKWYAPHPPGTWLNLPEGTELEIMNSHEVIFHFPYPEGLALGKFRAQHQGNDLFWEVLGFGYKKLGTAEGHW
ncbi:ABC transporter substrate-binding protein [Aquisalibacillus elongatus]|uniref:ABC transporter substrate-binding protein n=1 Tax=Aquisalibacillus elongatus TaxID=485577 RepID=UPI001473AA0B|nr:ABC transporter substrate-binding protein [Aquisalibacillus elongatus]